MSLLKIWIHAMWAVKNRQPLLVDGTRETLENHIFETSRIKNIVIDTVGGCSDHIHCLLRLSNDQSPNMVLQLIKGESSLWINKKNLVNQKFEWEKEFIAVSIGESQVDQVREYIRNQVEVHTLKSFEEEYNEFITRYKIDNL